MKITYPVKNATVMTTKVMNLLYSILELSRFTADINIESTSRTNKVVIRNVRLTTPKAYCGNHPNACENGGTREQEQPHRRSRYLEGADWVEFNDLVNDLLDRLHLSAKFESSQMIMRKGNNRRINYGSTSGSFRGFVWDKKGSSEDFANFNGETAPDSTFPKGTPGQYKDKYSEVG